MRQTRARFLVAVRENGAPLPFRLRRCDSFLCRLRGLTFRRSLAPDEGLLFVEPRESRLGAAIHMCFVFFPIGVVWLDADGTVVDATVAKPFRLYYAPRAPARFFLEGPPALADAIVIGEQLVLRPLDSYPDAESV